MPRGYAAPSSPMRRESDWMNEAVGGCRDAKTRTFSTVRTLCRTLSAIASLFALTLVSHLLGEPAHLDRAESRVDLAGEELRVAPLEERPVEAERSVLRRDRWIGRVEVERAAVRVLGPERGAER